MFQSAKYVLKKSLLEKCDIHLDSHKNQVYSLNDMEIDGVNDVPFDRNCHSDENNPIQENKTPTIKKQKTFQDPTQHNTQHFKKSKVMITLLLSQAAEWEIEKLANAEGFILIEIIPFEDVIFGTYGYSRKRTYSDDIFPSSSSFFPTLSNNNNDCHPDTTSFELLNYNQRSQWQRNVVEAWTFVFIPNE